MDSFYFLHTRSLCNLDYCEYKSGLISLNSLSEDMIDGEKRIKSWAVYDNPLYLERLCADYSETDCIIKFIEQCTSIDNDIDNDLMFAELYPLQDVGFLGISFCGISGIASHRKIVDSTTLSICRKQFLVRLIKEGKDQDLVLLLGLLYPMFTFSSDAQRDLLWWKHNDVAIMDSVFDLIDDIPAHPFTGGLGKTEVLSNTTHSVSSKRITQKDRLTYTFGEHTFIHRCMEHY